MISHHWIISIILSPKLSSDGKSLDKESTNISVKTTHLNNTLFVYGSLMSGVATPIATYLKSNSIFLGEAKLEGKLYDLGKYPGLVPEVGCGQWVKGHVFELSDAKKMLPVLDKYEGTTIAFEQPTEYIRVEASVQLNNQAVTCWLYRYNYPTDHLSLISSGDYLAHLSETPAYQEFLRSLVDYTRH